MEVIIASHTVKPSSPTPVTFKQHKLSSLDQITPPSYISFIFFYEHDKSKHHEEISCRLKQSLSDTLTIFYPLAGTIKQNLFVDCNDRGSEFVEARVHARLAQIIQNPKMEELKQLVPADSSSHNDDVILSVKTNYFDCGGIALGVCLSHKLGDGSSFAAFMNAWAATCRGEGSRIIHPSFDLALHFAPTDWPPLPNSLTKGKILTKRLVFESKKIEMLRQEAASAAAVKNPSRVEAVSAFIWKSFIEANKGKRKSKSSEAIHVVNLRPRTVPPLPDHVFGNSIGHVTAVALPKSEEKDEDNDLEYYVSKLRVAIRGLDDDYINKVIKDEQYYSRIQNEVFAAFEPGKLCFFTSWCRFPVYDVNFGWGKPVWVGTASDTIINGVILMSTPSGDGMEAWVTYDPDEDDFFQKLRV
ncbi:hypothetical protein C2S52_001582 [Perilla frutescens var. hirtella]|nr:hypothetical protein C2S52_001582 [Perilla frutescens var. hirtella]